jgi:hypothetical protein
MLPRKPRLNPGNIRVEARNRSSRRLCKNGTRSDPKMQRGEDRKKCSA